MTKEEFSELEDICKSEWRTLAETGAKEKSDSVNQYYLECPACDIAKTVQEWAKAPRYALCVFCPITLWREKARKYRESLAILDYYTVCEFGYLAYYTEWRCATTREERKVVAKKIAEMEWSWIPEYEKI